MTDINYLALHESLERMRSRLQPSPEVMYLSQRVWDFYRSKCVEREGEKPYAQLAFNRVPVVVLTDDKLEVLRGIPLMQMDSPITAALEDEDAVLIIWRLPDGSKRPEVTRISWIEEED